MPLATTCKRDGLTIGIVLALALRKSGTKNLHFICGHCGESVKPHRASKTGMAAHFEHKQRNNVSGHSKPATKGRMKTSHFEGSIASWAARAALGRNERTQRELAAFDFNFGGQRLVQPADCARTGHQPGDGRKVFAAGPVKTSHFDPRL